MQLLSSKQLNKKLFSKLAESIGTKIRKQIIESKKTSPQKEFSIRKINKVKTQPFNPEQEDKQFWTNPYKTQKHKWINLSQSRSFFAKKQDINQYKKYELEKFKQKLKTSLEDIHLTKQLERQINHSRVRSFKSNLISARNQKVDAVLYGKQLQAEKVRRILQRKKAEARIHKRRIELDVQFNKWQRQEEKLMKLREFSQNSKGKKAN